MDEIVELLKAIEPLATLVAISIGGVWAYKKLKKRREHFPHIEFTVDVEFVGVQGDQWLVEVVAYIENKGMVRYSGTDFYFNLRCLFKDDPVEEGGAEIHHQINIPHLIKKGIWLGDIYIEPGIRSRYSYIAAVSCRASFVLVNGNFVYEGSEIVHTSKKLIRVPALIGAEPDNLIAKR